MAPPEYEPDEIGTFGYFQMYRERYARDMKAIADVIGSLMEITLRETNDKAIYLYSATELRRLMALVRKVEKIYFGKWNDKK